MTKIWVSNPPYFFFPCMTLTVPTSGSQNEHREQVTRIIGWELLRVILVPFTLLRYVTLTYCSDSLTLVRVFSLFTHCNKYRIYFSILEGGPGGASPRHHLLRYLTLTYVVSFTDTSQCIQSFHSLQQVPNLLFHILPLIKTRLGPHKALLY